MLFKDLLYSGCLGKAPDHSGQGPHWLIYHVIPYKAAEQRASDLGPTHSQVQVPWLPGEQYLQKVVLYQI